jgi:hypothetical protein
LTPPDLILYCIDEKSPELLTEGFHYIAKDFDKFKNFTDIYGVQIPFIFFLICNNKSAPIVKNLESYLQKIFKTIPIIIQTPQDMGANSIM